MVAAETETAKRECEGKTLGTGKKKENKRSVLWDDQSS